MGGFWAIHAAATSPSIAGAIAICPAGEEHLRRMLDAKELDFRTSETSRDALAAWLGEHDLREAAELMGSKPLIILHAKGDERIPSDFSEEIAARKPRARRSSSSCRAAITARFSTTPRCSRSRSPG